MTKKPPPDSASGTADLAEDLLDSPTRMITRDGAPAGAPAAPSESLDEQFQSAKILFNEGMHDESKHRLHAILIADPAHRASRSLLDKIHAAELKQIFSGDETRTSSHPAEGHARPPRERSAEVRGTLERDLGLGADPLEHLSLMENFFSNLEELADTLPAEDLHDLAASFLATGLYGSAIHVLEKLQERVSAVTSPTIRRSVALLLAEAHVHGDHAAAAVTVLQEVVQDSELAREEKLDFFYWLARAQLALEQWDEAASWLRAVRDVKPGHRDSSELLEFLATRARATSPSGERN